jgi:hypothetical protein
VVGEATGKGVPAALVMATTCGMLQLAAQALGSSSPGEVKFLKLDEYAPRQPRHPDELQQVLFPYAEVLWRAGERFDASGTPDSGEVAR